MELLPRQIFPRQVFRRSDTSTLAEWWRTVDKGLIAAALILLGAGLVLSLAAGPAAASRTGQDDPFYYVYRQAVFVAISAALLVGSSTLNAVWVRRVCAGLFVLSWQWPPCCWSVTKPRARSAGCALAGRPFSPPRSSSPR
jgi:hypothetical protein